MEFRRGSKRVRLNYHQINKRLSKTIRETDAGVIIQDSHSPKQHIIRTTTVNNPVGNTNTGFFIPRRRGEKEACHFICSAKT